MYLGWTARAKREKQIPRGVYPEEPFDFAQGELRDERARNDNPALGTTLRLSRLVDE
jgi:hypothetical protein